MKRCWLPCLLLGLSSLVACDKSPKGDAGETSAAAATSAAATITLSDEDIPVAEDYITEATKEVTEDNYAAELDKLEKEINSAQ